VRARGACENFGRFNGYVSAYLESARVLLRAAGWRAALYILRSRTFGRNDARLRAHVDLAHGNLWFDRIFLLCRSTGWRSRGANAPRRIDEGDERLGVRNALVSAIGDGLFASQRRSRGTHSQEGL
jgi:hypothetical protein